MDRDQDIMTSGFRHPFKALYRAGCDKDGKLRALDVQLFSNGGYSMDLSLPVMDRALFHIDNCYHWPNRRITCIKNIRIFINSLFLLLPRNVPLT